MELLFLFRPFGILLLLFFVARFLYRRIKNKNNNLYSKKITGTEWVLIIISIISIAITALFAVGLSNWSY